MEMAGEVFQKENVEIEEFKQNKTLAISQEKAEEMDFVPSALSKPRGPTYWCDNRCSEKSICVSSATMNSWCSRASRG